MAEKLSDELKVFSIGGKRFEVPKEIIHRQYFKIASMFKDLGIKSSEVMDSPKLDRETNEIEMNFKAGDTLKRMLVAGKMPEFFATVLVPEGEKIWKKEYVVEHLELMEDIGDATALEIVGIFLTGRANLIVNLWEIFIAFLNKNKGLIKNLNSLTKAEEANKSLEDV